MKDFRDRQPTKVGRRKITHENGTSEFVTVEMADDPAEEGTPLNRKTFMMMQGFHGENTEIVKESSKVTKITGTNSDGDQSEVVITKSGSNYTIEEKFTGESGLSISKKTTIMKNGKTFVIGGELNE